MEINFSEAKNDIYNVGFGISYAKQKRKEQKEKMKDTSFQEKSKLELKISIIAEDIFGLEKVFSRLFPISELHLENGFVEEFFEIYKMAQINIDIFLHRFFMTYKRYGFLGLRTNVKILRQELLVK